MLLIFLLFSIVFLGFAYFVFRVIIKKNYKNNMRLTSISYTLEILVFAIHANSIYLILPSKWPNFPPFPENQYILVVSAIVFGFGLAILLISWFGLGTKQSLGIGKNKLETGGLYNYSRNPQLVGYGIMLIAFTLIYFSYLVLIWFLLYIAVSYFMVKSEEEFLERTFNEAYKAYCAQVPRIIKI